uniref:AAA+ ATPase domain-containing protein n=1 Tax=Fagus sylvatica TaxID=28930 RepID=A0A2N9J6N9_FAGSY
MDAAISIGAKTGEYMVEPIGQQVGYLIHLNSNIKNLKDQFQKLGDKRHGVQLLIDAERMNGQVILPEVNRWVENADEIRQGLQRFIDEDVKADKKCLGGWCQDLKSCYCLGRKAEKKTQEIDAEKRKDLVIALEVEQWVQMVDNISQGLQRFIDEDKMCLDLKSRYSLSRKAKKKTLAIEKLLSDAPSLNKMSCPPPPQGIGSSSIEGFKDFESRISMIKEVLEALRDDNINMIAICGMGGIGKTTMAKEVAKRAKDDKLSYEVAMAVVSQNQDLRKIQGQIADMLGLELKKESEAGRADQLKSRLMQSKSVLVILDDVWDVLNLEEVGIPYGGQHNRCKILLTSRRKEACNQMRSQKIVAIKDLSKEEAWNLFREMAGNCVDTPDLRPTAEEVAKECGGLPVAVVTVGRALENKTKDEWIAALEQLKKSIPKNIPGLHSKVYSSIKFSYSYLKSDEAKSCFLLCCLFPEDYSIPIEYLVRYGVGRRLFEKIDNVAEARSRVHAMVKDLKRSFLLLDSELEECVKMHDVVRDVSISIAEELGFLVGCNDKMEEWPEKDTNGHYAAISLFSQEMKRHPDGIECPKLELLQLGKTFSLRLGFLPANLFQGMKELKVLSIQEMSFSSLPQSIQVLQNLRTLHLEYCELADVSTIGALGNLEILSFLGSKIKELPREIGNLGHLKLLDLSKCFTLERIPYGLLSSLSRLEELYMGGIIVKWEPLEGNGEGNASLAELNSLSHHLMALEIIIPSIKLLPKDLHFKNQMTKFHIVIGDLDSLWAEERMRTGGYLFKNTLSLERSDLSDIVESLMLRQLLERSENLKLKQIGNLKNLKDVEYVIDATSDQNLRAAFPSLERLELSYLDNLEKIYDGQFPKRSFSGAQYACFGNLRYLNEGEDEKEVDMIKFPKLTKINCHGLQRLIGFCKPMDPVELVQPSHAKSTQPSSNLEVARMETNELTKDKMIDNQDTGSFPESRPISSKLFSSKTILWTPNLENLHIYHGDLLEVIFDLEGLKVDNDRQTITTLAQLKILTLKYLIYLTDVWKNVPRGIQVFQNLRSIKVDACHRLRYLFPLSVAKLLVELQSIEINSCDMIEDIVQRDGEEEAADFALFPKEFKCVPHSRNYGPMVESNRGTNNKSHGSSLVVSKESNLTTLEDPKARDIDNPSKIWYLFSSHIIECFKNLEEIDLRSCDSLEAIFQIEELAIEESHVASVLDQLRKLELLDLPKLMHIWKKGPERIIGFGNLRSLEVRRCNNLTYLFSPSIAKLLVMLEEIQVIDCEKIEEILTRAREEEGKEKDIVLFNKVNSLLLMDLPNLKCFCNEANAFEWPSLKKVGVIRSPNLRMFVPANLETPELEEVYEDYDFDYRFQKYNFERPAQWKGDLNATIEHIFKGKDGTLSQQISPYWDNLTAMYRPS